MELTPFVDAMRRDLSAATALADEPTRNVVDRLGTTLDTTARLAMYDALSQACAEISRELSPGAVEVRLAGRDPQFVVTAPPRVTPNPPTPPVAPTAPIPPEAPSVPGATTVLPVSDGDTSEPDGQDDQEGSDGGSARITLRLPGTLKNRVDEAAARSGMSVNAWLVQAVQDAVGNQRDRDRDRDRGRNRGRRGGFDLGLGNLGAEISREVNDAMREVNRELKNVGRQGKHNPGTQLTGWFR
jgi:predicted transcriptional regulator